MDTQRLILFAALAFVLLLLWEAWQEDYGVGRTEQPVASTPAGVPSDAQADLPTATMPSAGQAEELPSPEKRLQTAQRIHVRTDVLDVEIDTHGGDIRRVALRGYPEMRDEPDIAFQLMDDESVDFFIAQFGLLSATGSAANHHSVFHAEQNAYRLTDGTDSLRVDLQWRSDDGLQVTKSYTFYRGKYVVDISQRVTNTTAADWTGRQYRQLQRTQPADSGGFRFVYTYTGGVIYSPEEKYEKIDFDDMAAGNLARDIRGGWLAMIQHYFLAAWIPVVEELDSYYTKALQGSRYVLGMVSPQRTISAGESTVFQSRFYAGPKTQSKLEEIAPGLELTVDYGFLTVLAKPLFWLLEKLHGLLGNWGWAIVGVTLLIKLVFYKLSEASYRSMANMRRVAPRMQTMKERYGDDKQKLQQAMMDLYKKEKINPLGGCLPILVQIPVFIALYWVLLESVELRQAPFILWLNDLSTPDPYFVLPLIMGATMLIQQKLNPAPPDPIQAKVMMVLPVVFTVFFAFFPSGLVLYWVVNNTLSIAQQWVITKRITGK